MFWLKIIFLFCLGAIFGSFGSVLVYRLMQLQYSDKKLEIIKSILWGRSYCPYCKHKLSVKDLVPIFSFLSSRGKCKYCGKSISFTYLWLELVSGFLFVFSYLILRFAGFVEDINFWIYVGWLAVFLWFFWLLVIGDFLYFYLIEVLWIFWFLWTVISMFLGLGDFKFGFISGLVFFFGFLFIYFFARFYVKIRFKQDDLEGLGFGDVMVGFIVGLSFGVLASIFKIDLADVVFYFFLYIILSSLVGIIGSLLLRFYNKVFKKQSVGNAIPFLPPMFVAYLVLLVLFLIDVI